MTTKEPIDELNELLRRAEQTLIARGYQVPASVVLDAEKNVRLTFAKENGCWRLLVASADGRGTPVEHASKRSRVLAAYKVPELERALVQAEDREGNEIAGAIDTLASWCRTSERA